MATTVIAITGIVISLIGVGIKVAAGKSVYNSLKDVIDINSLDNIKGFDEGYISITGQALDMLVSFSNYVGLLVLVCAFLCIIFNAFKLWSGTIEIKKTFVDIVYKCVLVTAVTLIYPTVVTKTYSLATKMGVEASGGADNIKLAFAKIGARVKKVWDNGASEMIEMLKGTKTTVDGKPVISEKMLKCFTSAGLTIDEAKAYATQQGFVVGDTGAKGILWWKNDQKKLENEAKSNFNNKHTVYEEAADGQTYATSDLDLMRQSIAIIRSLNQVLTATPESNLENGKLGVADILSQGDEVIKHTFYNPYIGKSDERLSMSALMKTALITAEMCSNGCLSKLETQNENGNVMTFQTLPAQDTRVVLDFIGWIMKSFLYKVLIIIAVMFVGIEYVITTIEFLICAAISQLLIPLYFIDATKQFATNILKMILNYFVKILVVTMMCFFVMTLFINMSDYIVGKPLGNSVVFLYYMFTIFLGMAFAKAGGKLASAVVSGNPSMGLGDIAQEFRGATHAAHVAGHHVQQFGHDLQKAGQGTIQHGQEGVRGKMAYNEGKKGAQEAGEKSFAEKFEAKGGGLEGAAGDWLESMGYSRSEKGMLQAQKDAGKAAKDDWARDFNSQALKDWGFKKLTGTDRLLKGNRETGEFGGNLQYGQEFIDQNGNKQQATWEDVRNAVKYRGGQNAASSVDQWGNRKMTAQDRLNKVRAKKGEPVLPPSYER